MADFQIAVGRDTLGKLLKLWGLSIRRKVKRRKPNVIEKILIALSERANLLKRTLIAAPLQAVSTDMTVILYDSGRKKAYLCEHKDVFGQMVYGWTMSRRMDAALVMSSLKRAFRTIRNYIGFIPKALIVHQDRGSQYTGYEYVDAVLKEATLSYSAKGRPTDNSGQESRFGRFKDEWKDEISELKTFNEVVRFINKKVHYYNHKRLHTSINVETPYEFTKTCLKSVPKFNKKWFRFFRT